VAIGLAAIAALLRRCVVWLGGLLAGARCAAVVAVATSSPLHVARLQSAATTTPPT